MLIVFSPTDAVPTVVDQLKLSPQRSRVLYDWTSLYVHPPKDLDTEALLEMRAALRSQQADIIQIAALLNPNQPAQFVFDMDSTLIQQEVIDELARVHGVYDDIARITREAMEGGLDFTQALRKRCALLRGLPFEALEQVYRSLTLNDGVKELLALLQAGNAVTCVFSGGFMPVLRRFQEEYGITEIHANELEVKNGMLTGRVVGDIIDKHAKCERLSAIRGQYRIAPGQTVAVGDGANDVLMIQAADIGMGFHAKAGLKQMIANWIDFAPMFVLDALFEDNDDREDQNNATRFV